MPEFNFRSTPSRIERALHEANTYEELMICAKNLSTERDAARPGLSQLVSRAEYFADNFLSEISTTSHDRNYKGSSVSRRPHGSSPSPSGRSPRRTREANDSAIAARTEEKIHPYNTRLVNSFHRHHNIRFRPGLGSGYSHHYLWSKRSIHVEEALRSSFKDNWKWESWFQFLCKIPNGVILSMIDTLLPAREVNGTSGIFRLTTVFDDVEIDRVTGKMLKRDHGNGKDEWDGGYTHSSMEEDVKRKQEKLATCISRLPLVKKEFYNVSEFDALTLTLGNDYLTLREQAHPSNGVSHEGLSDPQDTNRIRSELICDAPVATPESEFRVDALLIAATPQGTLHVRPLCTSADMTLAMFELQDPKIFTNGCIQIPHIGDRWAERTLTGHYRFKYSLKGSSSFQFVRMRNNFDKRELKSFIHPVCASSSIYDIMMLKHTLIPSKLRIFSTEIMRILNDVFFSDGDVVMSATLEIELCWSADSGYHGPVHLVPNTSTDLYYFRLSGLSDVELQRTVGCSRRQGVSTMDGVSLLFLKEFHDCFSDEWAAVLTGNTPVGVTTPARKMARALAHRLSEAQQQINYEDLSSSSDDNSVDDVFEEDHLDYVAPTAPLQLYQEEEMDELERSGEYFVGRRGHRASVVKLYEHQNATRRRRNHRRLHRPPLKASSIVTDDTVIISKEIGEVENVNEEHLSNNYPRVVFRSLRDEADASRKENEHRKLKLDGYMSQPLQHLCENNVSRIYAQNPDAVLKLMDQRYKRKSNSKLESWRARVEEDYLGEHQIFGLAEEEVIPDEVLLSEKKRLEDETYEIVKEIDVEAMIAGVNLKKLYHEVGERQRSEVKFSKGLTQDQLLLQRKELLKRIQRKRRINSRKRVVQMRHGHSSETQIKNGPEETDNFDDSDEDKAKEATAEENLLISKLLSKLDPVFAERVQKGREQKKKRLAAAAKADYLSQRRLWRIVTEEEVKELRMYYFSVPPFEFSSSESEEEKHQIGEGIQFITGDLDELEQEAKVVIAQAKMRSTMAHHPVKNYKKKKQGEVKISKNVGPGNFKLSSSRKFTKPPTPRNSESQVQESIPEDKPISRPVSRSYVVRQSSPALVVRTEVGYESVHGISTEIGDGSGLVQTFDASVLGEEKSQRLPQFLVELRSRGSSSQSSRGSAPQSRRSSITPPIEHGKRLSIGNSYFLNSTVTHNGVDNPLKSKPSTPKNSNIGVSRANSSTSNPFFVPSVSVSGTCSRPSSERDYADACVTSKQDKLSVQQKTYLNESLINIDSVNSFVNGDNSTVSRCAELQLDNDVRLDDPLLCGELDESLLNDASNMNITSFNDSIISESQPDTEVKHTIVENCSEEAFCLPLGPQSLSLIVEHESILSPLVNVDNHIVSTADKIVDETDIPLDDDIFRNMAQSVISVLHENMNDISTIEKGLYVQEEDVLDMMTILKDFLLLRSRPSSAHASYYQLEKDPLFKNALRNQPHPDDWDVTLGIRKLPLRQSDRYVTPVHFPVCPAFPFQRMTKLSIPKTQKNIPAAVESFGIRGQQVSNPNKLTVPPLELVKNPFSSSAENVRLAESGEQCVLEETLFNEVERVSMPVQIPMEANLPHPTTISINKPSTPLNSTIKLLPSSKQQNNVVGTIPTTIMSDCIPVTITTTDIAVDSKPMVNTEDIAMLTMSVSHGNVVPFSSPRPPNSTSPKARKLFIHSPSAATTPSGAKFLPRKPVTPSPPTVPRPSHNTRNLFLVGVTPDSTGISRPVYLS